MGRSLAILSALMLLAAAPAARGDTTESGTLRLVSAGDFQEPTYLASPPGDPDTLFVSELGTDGTPAAPSRILVSRGGQVSTFLDLSDEARAASLEQGLLSFAFAPDYAQSGLLYAFYTAEPEGRVRIEELRRSDTDPYTADPTHRRVVLEQTGVTDLAHVGGQVDFGPDGLLWASIGDGSPRHDEGKHAQRLDDGLLGKLIRIDPRAAGGGQYSIPPDNPFLATPGARGEIWLYGLRNPWRFSFDAATGDLTIGDVGQDTREEVDFFGGSRGRGRNLGWSHWEGTFEHDATEPLQGPGAYAPPVLEYGHDAGCAVTGGYVSRDRRTTELAGRYVYGDFCRGELRSTVLTEGGASGHAPLGDPGSPLQVSSLNSFGQDGRCRLYVISLNGPVYRLDSTQSAAEPGCPVPPAGATSAGAAVAGEQATAPPAQDRTAPLVSRTTLLRGAFAVGPARTALVAGRHPPRGTAFRYTLSERADVTIRIYRALAGRRVRGRCALGRRGGRRCVGYRLQGTLLRRGLAAGRHSTPFSGRLGRRALAPGAYRATVRARDRAGNLSVGRAVTFRILAWR